LKQFNGTAAERFLSGELPFLGELMMKYGKIFCLLLFLVMIVSIFASCASTEPMSETKAETTSQEQNKGNGNGGSNPDPEKGEEGGIEVSKGLSYTLLDDNTYAVGVGTESNATKIVIPATYEGKPVTQIRDGGFYGCEKLESITIPNSITIIGFQAFCGCENLERVTIPDGVTSMGHGAFLGCKSLISVTIPGSIRVVSEAAFNGCSALTEVTIEDGVESIGEVAFGGGCTNLVKVTIAASVTEIPSSAFEGCENIKTAKVPTWALNALRFSSLEIVVICGGESIDMFTFASSLETLTEVTLGDTVTTIGDSSFQGVSTLEKIVISDSVTEIGNDAFLYCDSLTDVYYEGTQEQWNEICKENVGLGSSATVTPNFGQGGGTPTPDNPNPDDPNPEPECEHEWNEATCETPKTCS